MHVVLRWTAVMPLILGGCIGLVHEPVSLPSSQPELGPSVHWALAYEAREGVSFYFVRVVDDLPGGPKPSHCGVYLAGQVQTDSTCYIESVAWYEPSCRKWHPWTVQVNLTHEDRHDQPIVVLFAESAGRMEPVARWSGSFTHCDHFDGRQP